MTDLPSSGGAPDLDTVYFVTAQRLAPGEVELHKASTARLTRSLEEVKGDWQRIVKQIAEMVSGTDTSAVK